MGRVLSNGRGVGIVPTKKPKVGLGGEGSKETLKSTHFPLA
jgi:hypothetical protein